MNVRYECASPTCATAISMVLFPALGTVPAQLEARGWALQQQPGDDRRLPYCSRCVL